MNLQRIKWSLLMFTIFISFLVFSAHFCLFGRRLCMRFPRITTESSKLLNTYSPSISSEYPTEHEEDFLVIPGLNQHIWESNCLNNIETLCNFPVFPNAPDKRNVILSTEILTESYRAAHDGQRLFGYLLPNLTGEYYFAVSTNGYAEIWLSSSKNWEEAKEILFLRPFDLQLPLVRLDFNASKRQISRGIRLKAKRRYYLEIVYAPGSPNNIDNNFIQVAWKRPRQSIFEIIESNFLSLYKNDSEKWNLPLYDDEMPGALPCRAKNQNSYRNKYMRPESFPYLKHQNVQRTLNYCNYRPSYLVNRAELSSFGQYYGVYKYARKTNGYRFPNVEGITRNPGAEQAFIAEYPLDENDAWSIVKLYMTALRKAYKGKYELESIKHVEKKEDPGKGGRYFLELVVKDLTDGKRYILAEYVFQPNGRNIPLCYPEGLQWNRTADVYLILTAKNLGRWIHHFIKNIEKIFQETKDEHLHVVIYDFDSPDINLKQAFERTTLKNYRYIIRPGKYSRTLSFSEAIESIKDPNAIVVTVDLHLDIGSQFINDVRKHCAKGKTVYAPQIVFLQCGGSSALPKGVWYHYSYGTIAMYKQDWDNFGGFSKEFLGKETWGGEDWDIIDSAVKGGLEIERKRSPWIYHYHHTKTGMW